MGLNSILKERNQGETVDFCIDTNYFGFGSYTELEKAHNNNYKKESCIIDMWHNDSHRTADKIDITFYPNESKYRGNIYKNEKCIGDYVADSSQAIEQKFKHLTFNWG